MGNDIGLIVAIVGSSVAIIGVLIAIMFWVRSESNDLRKTAQEDRKDIVGFFRQSEKDLNEHRKEMNQISRNIDNTVQAIQSEIRDFHYALSDIKRKVG
jgi:hypothetical protein